MSDERERTIIEGVIARASDYVTDPPRGDDSVIRLASPSELTHLFEATVDLALGSEVNAADPDALLAAVEQIIDYSMHTSHPRFANQNFAGPDPIAVVGDWLGAALNTTAATYEVAPVFTLMESAVLAKLGRLAGYPVTEDLPALPPGIFCAGGSMGTLLALQLARHRHQPDITTAGANGDRMALFVSEAGHYAATKSAALLGIGSDGVIKVPSDHEGAIIPRALVAAIESTREAGMTPFAVIGTAGTTVTAAFDDLVALADICEHEQLWLHVDACYGGSALFSPGQAHRMAGVARSDSCVWNLHKMMGMTQQCTALLVREPEQLAACFATGANYLFQSDKLHADYDTGDRTFHCARRIDVLKLWLTWQARGDQGFADRVDHATAMAAYARGRVEASDGALVPVVNGSFTNTVFVWVPPHLRPLPVGDSGELDVSTVSTAVREELNRCAPKIKARLQADGSAMIGFQPVHGVNAFRMICMNPALQPSDIDAMLAAISAGVD